jgi:hypothetical protein
VGLTAGQAVDLASEELEEEITHAELEKGRLKLEKKKAKAETKAKKKDH